MKGRIKLAAALMIVARGLLVLVTLFWGVFALLSLNSAQDGRAWWTNIPNIAPWLLLGGAVWLSFGWPRAGGGLVVLLGVASVFFFTTWTSPVVLLGVSVPLLIAGMTLVLCGKDADQKD